MRRDGFGRWFQDLRDFRWQDGYAAFTVSLSALPDVRRYIEGQGEHHKKLSFEEELTKLLDKHGIEYDPMRLNACASIATPGLLIRRGSVPGPHGPG